MTRELTREAENLLGCRLYDWFSLLGDKFHDEATRFARRGEIDIARWAARTAADYERRSREYGRHHVSEERI